MLPMGATAAEKAAKVVDVCKSEDDEEDDKDPNLRFAIGSTCVEIDGSVEAVYSRAKPSQPGLPLFFSRFGSPNSSP